MLCKAGCWSGPGGLSDDVLGLLVQPPAAPYRMPQLSRAGPLAEGHLAYEIGLHPAGTCGVEGGHLVEGRCFPAQPAHGLAQFLQFPGAETSANAAHVAQLPAV